MTNVVGELTAGGLAGFTGIVVTQPLDTVRIRLQNGGYTGIFNCVKTTIQREGVRGLFKGILSPCVSVGLMNSLLFYSYAEASQFVAAHGVDNMSLPEIWLAGSMSGFVCSFITAPTELVKVHAQIKIDSKGQLREVTYHIYLISFSFSLSLSLLPSVLLITLWWADSGCCYNVTIGSSNR